MNKYGPEKDCEDIRDIVYTDEKFERCTENIEIDAKQYGGVELCTKKKAALKIDPGFMTYPKIDEIEAEVEIEKGCTKARYFWMNNDNNAGEDGPDNNNPARNDSFMVLDLENRVADYANVRATNIPTCQRIFPPKPSTLRREIVMQNIKDKMISKVKEYKQKNCNSKGWIKKTNFSKEENEGLKLVSESLKEKEMVVFVSDKTGHFVADTIPNYENALHEHVVNDRRIDNKKVRSIEMKCNHHIKQFNRMFHVGATWGHERRVANATTATNVPPPPLYGLRKDHKPVPPGQEESGPPLRALAGARQSPNSRLGHFLSNIVNDYVDCAGVKSECRSSEEMRAAFQEFNRLDSTTRMKCKTISMDVKALYPSMSWPEIITAIKEMITESEMEIKNVDWKEVGKYLAVMMTEQEIQEEGLTHVVPKRRGIRLRKITINYLQQKKNADKWLPARSPGVRQKRKMLALAVSYGVYTTLSSHTYCVGDKKYLQMSGGPIGLELTGAVSRAYMMRWDTLYLQKVKKAGISMLLYERYIDDSNQSAVVPSPGATYDTDRKKVVIDTDIALEDEDKEARLARVLKEIANDVIPEIKMVEDYPSKNDDDKMPVLDMKIWMTEDESLIMHEHYEKPMSSKKVMHAESAISASCKQSVHTQEVMRRLFNSSRMLDWKTETAPVISGYMSRMMQAGYPEKYRRDTLCRSLRIYDKMVEDDTNGVRPLYRPKDYDRIERKNRKQKKKESWSNKGGYIAPIFVPPTPHGELAMELKKIAECEAEAGVQFRIVESGGRSVKMMLQKSNPTATKGCDEDDCLPCRTAKGAGGNCRSCGINYQVECELCPPDRKSSYHGESARNLYTRGKEHQKNYSDRTAKSFMLKHQAKEHQNVAGNYTAKVTGTARDCLTRQVREAVHIRRSEVPTLNSKTEWHQPALFRVQSEIYRG